MQGPTNVSKGHAKEFQLPRRPAQLPKHGETYAWAAIAVHSKRHNDQNASLCRYLRKDAFIVTTGDFFAQGVLKRSLNQITCSKRVPVFLRTLHSVHFLLLHMLQTRPWNCVTSAYRTCDNKLREGRFKHNQCLAFLSLPLLGVSNSPLQFNQYLAFARIVRKN